MIENINNRRMKKMKKSLALSKSTAASYDKETSNSSMPNQYFTVKNVTKEGEVIKDDIDQTNDLLMKLLNLKSKLQIRMKQMKILIMNIGHQAIMLINT
jgi:hypothetical protein